MTITLDQAKLQLNIQSADTTDDVELQFYVDATNAWMATKVVDTTPAPVVLATRILLGHLWETQRGPTSSPYTGAEDLTVVGAGYAIPNRVLELIDPYRSKVTTKTTPTYSFPDAVAWPDSVENPSP